MPTRSIIGIINDDSSIDAIYCHFDGHPSHHAPLLLNYYNEPNKVRALIDLGAISVLAKNISPSGNTHSFDSCEPDTVLAYHRDRGEEWEPNRPAHYANLDDFRNTVGWEDYFYLFNTAANEWLYTNCFKIPFQDCFKPLTLESK